MTKQEFIQEAALRLITAKPDADIPSVAATARELADKVFEVEVNADEYLRNMPDVYGDKPTVIINHDDPIAVLVAEIDRMEEEEVGRRMREAFDLGVECKYQKKGYAEKVSWACYRNEIKTLLDLIGIGRRKFIKLQNIGKKSCEVVDKALENLYGIKTW